MQLIIVALHESDNPTSLYLHETLRVARVLLSFEKEVLLIANGENELPIELAVKEHHGRETVDPLVTTNTHAHTNTCACRHMRASTYTRSHNHTCTHPQVIELAVVLGTPISTTRQASNWTYLLEHDGPKLPCADSDINVQVGDINVQVNSLIPMAHCSTL